MINIKEIKDIELQVYPANVKILKPLKNITLWRFFNAIGNMNPELLKIYEDIAECEIKKDFTKKAELKAKLFYFIPAVELDPNGRRSYKDIVKFNGLMTLDFDHIENAVEFKDYIFHEYDFIIAAWLSSSKKGVRCLVKIPVVKTVDEYKEYFWGLYNMIMNKYIGSDTAPQNCVLPLYLSPDKEILIADEFTEWKTKGQNPKQIKESIEPFKYDAKNRGKKTEWAIENTKKAIHKISDNGHPQLREASYALGGYVGAGYITESEAINLMDNLIVGNAYLNIKPNVYKKTARTTINKGINKPLYL
jgi:hypothetical protein